MKSNIIYKKIVLGSWITEHPLDILPILVVFYLFYLFIIFIYFICLKSYNIQS